MKTVRSALLAAAILAGVPSIAFAQPDDNDRGGRPVGQGRAERRPDAQPEARQQRGPDQRGQDQRAQDQGGQEQRQQFQPQQQRQDFGNRQDFRGRPDPVQAQPAARSDGQRPQGYGRDPGRFAQAPNQPGVDPRRDNRGGFDARRDDGSRPGFGNDDRGRGPNGFDNNNRFRGGDNRFDNDNRFRGDNRFGSNDNRYSGGNRFPPDWRNDRRYDWQGYRNNNRQLYRAPRYSPPRGYGYGYRPFARGYQLQPFFYGQNYWINDPWQYRLPPAYGPYRWVRYYNDVLLVDIDTGFVVDVIQNFFW